MSQDQDQTPDGHGSTAKLDINAVWSRGVVLLRENLQLLGIIAGVFVLLPNAFLQFALPSESELSGPFKVMLDPASADETKIRAAEALAEAISPFVMMGGIVIVIGHVGYAAIVALMGRQRPTVGEAILLALKAILPLVLAILVYLVGMYSLLLVIQLIMTPLGSAASNFLGAMVGVLAILFLTARLALTLPVIVLEEERNPIKALRRSWAVTAPSSNNVFGFWMLLAVAWFVTLMVQSLVTLVFVAIPGPGSTATLISGLLGGIFSMIWGAIYCAMSVSMLRELRGPDAANLATDFD